MTDARGAVNRRRFLKGAAVAGAAALAAPAIEARQKQPPAPERGTAASPSAAQIAKESGPLPDDTGGLTVKDAGSDFMVDVFKSLDFEYIAANPGSAFRGLQESFVNYGGNRAPEWLTCCHEESSVGIADGYYRVTGKPMAVAAHGTVGLQHAAMTIYNAFVARNPVYIILGNALDASARRPGVEWSHSAQDAAAMVRDYIKWDDTPMSLTHFAESAVRAYKIAMTVPRAPVVLVLDGDLQERGIGDRSKLRIPKLTLTAPPAADPAAIAEVARRLVQAERPVIVAGRAARSQEGMDLVVELAETLQAPVLGGGRNIPNQHPLSGGGSVAKADVILTLQQDDVWGTLNSFRDQQERTTEPIADPSAFVISLGTSGLYLKSNYQDFQRYAEVDLDIAGDVEATLPSLIEACRRLITPDRRRALDERGTQIAAGNARSLAKFRNDSRYGWDASPITTPRVAAEMWEAIKDTDWALVGVGGSRLWNIDKYYRTFSRDGAAAVGSSLPIAVGAALAHRKHGRVCVALQNDGDLMYAPGALWTAVHHRIPLLFVMHNNRAYHQEMMHIQRMANRRERGITNAQIGTAITDPNIDYATLARSMGLYSEGPIASPNDLGPALKRAVARVQKGETALVDVVTQPR